MLNIYGEIIEFSPFTSIISTSFYIINEFIIKGKTNESFMLKEVFIRNG